MSEAKERATRFEALQEANFDTIACLFSEADGKPRDCNFEECQLWILVRGLHYLIKSGATPGPDLDKLRKRFGSGCHNNTSPLEENPVLE